MPPSAPSISLPVANGFVRLASSRRSPSALTRRHLVGAQEDLMGRMRGVGLVLVDEGRGVVGRRWTSSAVPSTPSVPASTVARVSTMKLVCGVARIVQRVVRLQRDENGAAAALVDEIEAVIEELAESVIHELNGADRPSSGVTLGMKNTSVSSAVPNMPSRPGLVTSRRGCAAAAATAAGLLAVWSTIRLEMMRGSASATLPCAAVVGVGDDNRPGPSRSAWCRHPASSR